ncbi:hypothetical protein [Flavobacterium ginsenosidimutans]|uniref:hypothetical protein n=1 Tax=Flavobacterium ginsenosidimutans TaxID=687844 RepID=UPI0013A5F61D|nr:hypothetical protein [Flavobacterium ginsenosidimutans]KAF2330481.1 hypothetical protein DM444_14120 [Flavobacterium ginsenosidimutans]
MKTTLAYIFQFLYWVWFVLFFFYTISEIFRLAQSPVGEAIVFMGVSTLVLFFVGLFLYLFTLTVEIPNEMNKFLRSGSLVFCVLLIIVFFIFIRNNGDLKVYY